MATVADVANPDRPAEAPIEKGLKSNALSLVSNVVIGVASTAPAYSLAATLGLIVLAVGVLSPTIVVLAFIPMLFVSIGYSELNKADPDCGTTFTWGTRTFGPWIGWLGGWGIVASDILVMASLAQVSGQYGFLLFGAHGIGNNPTSDWVLLVGVLFIVLLTYVCYRGIELSARIQRILLSVEVAALALFAVVALIRVASLSSRDQPEPCISFHIAQTTGKLGSPSPITKRSMNGASNSGFWAPGPPAITSVSSGPRSRACSGIPPRSSIVSTLV